MTIRPVRPAGPRGVTMTGVGLGVSAGVAVGPDGGGVCGGVRVGLGVGGAGVLMGLVVGGCGYAGGIQPVGVAVGESGVPVGIWTDVADGSGVRVGGDGVSGGKGVPRPSAGTGVGEFATTGGVCVPESCVPAGDVGVHVAAACDKVAVARDVAGEGSTGGNILLPPILLPATTVPITHVRLPATSAPIVRIASRDNERSRLIWLLPG